MSIITDPTLLNRLAEWRRKCTDGTITLEEMRESMRVLRANRMNAAEAAAKSKSGGGKRSAKAKAAPVNAGDLLDQLKGL